MQTIFYGASAMNPTRLREGMAKWGQIFYQFFGQSECPMVIANMRKKAQLTENRLLVIVSALRQLLHDEHFVTLLRAENLAERAWASQVATP